MALVVHHPNAQFPVSEGEWQKVIHRRQRLRYQTNRFPLRVMRFLPGVVVLHGSHHVESTDSAIKLAPVQPPGKVGRAKTDSLDQLASRQGPHELSGEV